MIFFSWEVHFGVTNLWEKLNEPKTFPFFLLKEICSKSYLKVYGKSMRKVTSKFRGKFCEKWFPTLIFPMDSFSMGNLFYGSFLLI